MTKRAPVPWLILFGCVALLSGCLASDSNEVVVLCALDREFSESILDDVSQELSVPMRKKFDVESNKTVGLANEIARDAKRPRADIFWNNEILHTIALEKAGLLEPFRPTSADRIPAAFRSTEGCWTGFAGRCRVLIVNTNLMPDGRQRPRSIDDLADEQFRSRCAIARPLFGTSATHAAVLFAAMGDEAATGFYRRLSNNCVVEGGNRQVARKVARGEFMFGLTDTDDAILELEKGSPVAIVFPDQQDGQGGTLLIPNTIAIIRGGPNTNAARRVVERLLRSDIENRLSEGGAAQIPLGRSPMESRLFKNEPPRMMEVNFDAAAEVWPDASKTLADLFPIGH